MTEHTHVSKCSKRSVRGMKSLMPLVLSSNPSPIAPSQNLGRRSMFRTIPPSHQSESSIASYYEFKYKPRSPERRDTPIYKAPGTFASVIANQTGRDICFSCGATKHICQCESKIGGDEKITSSISQQESHRQSQVTLWPESFEPSRDGRGTCEADNISKVSSVTAPLKESGHSSVCLGKPLVATVNETEWLADRNSVIQLLNCGLRPEAQSKKTSRQSSIETWIDHTSCCSEIFEESLNVATALRAAKASLVQCSGQKKASDHNSPRSSLLDSIVASSMQGSRTIPTRYTLVTSEDYHLDLNADWSPPPLYSERAQNETQTTQKPFLAFESPPLTPQMPIIDFPQSNWLGDVTSDDCYDNMTVWPLEHTSLALDLAIRTLDELEETVSRFPCCMLSLKSPIISNIRLQMRRRKSISRLPPAALESRRLNTSLRKSSARLKDIPRASSIPSNFTSTAHASILFEIMGSLGRIFPTSSLSLRSSLYASILASMYVSSQVSMFPDTWGGWHESWCWAKSAKVVSERPTISGPMQFHGDRLMRVQEDLQKCISYLIWEMESGDGEASMASMDAIPNTTLVRALEGMVMSIEKRLEHP